MEAPKKIYVVIDPDWGSMMVNYDRNDVNNIEYTRTDAFIERACKAFCKVCKMPNCNSKDCSYLKDFRNHVKGE